MNKVAVERKLDVRIESAGIFASEGEPAANEAIIVMREYGIDLLGHHAQPITSELIEKSDLILTMTEAHKMLFAQYNIDKVKTICEYLGIEGEIDDPYGGDVEEYEETAKILYEAVKLIADKIEGKLE